MGEDKELKLIIDQLINNESSSDKEMAIFLANETKYSIQRMQMLVGAARSFFLKNPTIDDEEALVFIKGLLVKIDRSI